MKVLVDGVDLGTRSTIGHLDFPRMVEGGLDAEVFAVWVEPHYWPDRAKERALTMIDALEKTLARHKGQAELARTVTDARRIEGQGKVVAFLGIEGGQAIEDDLANLELFHARGVRYMTLTWWKNTNWADGSGDKPRWHGLNDLGRKVVQEMNRLGMVVDVSHVSDETFFDVLETTNKPVIASHSNTRALHDHHRNLSDKMLRALAANGGVIGINFVAGFLDREFHLASQKLRQKLKPVFAEIKAKHKGDPIRGRQERWRFYKEKAKELLPPVPLDRVIDHIDHAAGVAGIDHVGLGSDFDGFAVGPHELPDCTKLPLITQKLLERGYSPADVEKILGENFLRVFKEVIGN